MRGTRLRLALGVFPPHAYRTGVFNDPARRVAIVGGNRIPFARSHTAYATSSNQEMLIAALEGLVERYNLHGEPRTGLSMGEHCERMAQQWQIPRDEQHRLAFDSHRQLAAGEGKRGLISICAAGGQGVVAILER